MMLGQGGGGWSYFIDIVGQCVAERVVEGVRVEYEIGQLLAAGVLDRKVG